MRGGGGQRGGRVQGQHHGQDNHERSQRGKRQATTPVGGVYKDSRRNINGDEEYDDDEDGEWTEVIYNRPKSPTNQPTGVPAQEAAPAQGTSSTQRSFAEAAASTSSGQTRRRSQQEDRPQVINKGLFKTSPPEGPMRDDITIEVRKINGIPFKGSLHLKEAKHGIFQSCLHLNTNLIHGIRFGFSDYPLVKFKLKEKINIDAFLPMEFFDYKRDYTVGNVQKSDTLECKIRGIRNDDAPVGQSADSDPSVRWVKVEGSEYGLEEGQILTWLDLYGVPVGELSEDVHPDSDSDGDPLRTGTYSIKMKLKTDIPQLLPMWGKRIRIYHRGIQKLCTNCFGAHARRNCRSPKIRWVDYVLRFMESHREIPPEYYGRWWKVVNDEFGELVEQQDEQTTAGSEGQDLGGEDDTDIPPETENTRSEISKNQTERQTEQRQQQSQAGARYERARIDNDEEDLLSDFLSFGMSIDEARQAHRKEQEMAELKQRMREHKRAIQRGAINTRGTAATRVGPTASSSSRGRGLSFN